MWISFLDWITRSLGGDTHELDVEMHKTGADLEFQKRFLVELKLFSDAQISWLTNMLSFNWINQRRFGLEQPRPILGPYMGIRLKIKPKTQPNNHSNLTWTSRTYIQIFRSAWSDQAVPSVEPTNARWHGRFLPLLYLNYFSTFTFSFSSFSNKKCPFFPQFLHKNSNYIANSKGTPLNPH